MAEEKKNAQNPETENENKEKFLVKAKRFGKEKALPVAKTVGKVAAKVVVGTFAVIGAVGTALSIAHRGQTEETTTEVPDQSQDSEEETAEE